MWYVAAVCVVVLISAVAGFAKSRPGSTSKSLTPLDAVTSATIADIVLPIGISTVSVEQINILLSRLETTEPPEQTMGAMCYEPMSAPEVAEYICPVCGEKTVYNYSQAAFISWELAGCRRMADSINIHTDFEVVLDERQFCDFCSPDSSGNDPSLVLKVVYGDGTEVENTVGITDLRMLDSFLEGNLYYTTSNDAQMPLQNYSGRMRELLGFEEE
jgi:hypothetical protein